MINIRHSKWNIVFGAFSILSKFCLSEIPTKKHWLQVKLPRQITGLVSTLFTLKAPCTNTSLAPRKPNKDELFSLSWKCVTRIIENNWMLNRPYMPRPFSHFGLSVLSRVLALLSASRGLRGRKDSDGFGVLRHEAADVVLVDAAVRVRRSTAQDARPVVDVIKFWGRRMI